MDSYIENNLMPNESITKKGTVHWIGFVPSVFIIIFMLLSMIFIVSWKDPMAWLFILFGVIGAIKFYIYYSSTELAVTSKRIIVKFGLIRRNTIEINHKNVESIKIKQDILGRILNYGTVNIYGVGGIKTPIARIIDPFDFRKAVLIKIDSN